MNQFDVKKDDGQEQSSFDNGNKNTRITKGIFEKSNKAGATNRINTKSIREKKMFSSDEEAQKAAQALNGASNAEDDKKQKQANEANKFNENDIRIIKDTIFNGFSIDTVEKKIMQGLVLNIEIMSMSTNEYDFISQIVFDYKKESVDEKQFPTLCQEKFESLFTSLLLAMQISKINNKPIVANEKDLHSIKTVVKDYSKFELLGIAKEEDVEKLIKLKKELVDRAFVFMNMENNVQSILNTIRAEFNKKISDLLNQEDLIKK